jgi:hypothetical protein
MSWQKESILVLVEAAPNWSGKYGSYLVCTGGITKSNQWRRLYPMPLDSIAGKIHRWDIIEVKTTEPEHDPRSESRKIDPDSIVISGSFSKDREDRRVLLKRLAEKSLDVAIKERRSIILIKPEIVDFHIVERKDELVQLTLNGKVFKEQPYRDVSLYYQWNCPEPCDVCSRHHHNMECFDWGAGVLWNRYKADRKVAEEKITEMCYDNMKEKFDAWFALGTHSRRPFSKWMVVSLLWMKKAS